MHSLVFAVALGAAATGPATPHEFLPQARALFRLVACAGDAPIPASVDPKALEAHCKRLGDIADGFRSNWVAKASPFLATLRPAGLPERVVYPFGGGDLVSALVTFPDAREYTLLSLETAGDPRLIDKISAADLSRAWARSQSLIYSQYKVAHSRTDRMAEAEREVLPAQLIYTLVALATLGYEPAGLTYFQIAADGTLHYLSAADLQGAPSDKADDPLFANMELKFRKRGESAERVFRHISANLDDEHMVKDPGPLLHLAQKGRVAAMTKAASFLLWGTNFSKIRDYLVANLAWMVSDATGLPPAVATAAGFEQETYGTWEGPFLTISAKAVADLVALYKAQPTRVVPMFYGYPDNNHHAHLIVTRPRPQTVAKP